MYKEKIEKIALEINCVDMVYIIHHRERQDLDTMLGMMNTDFDKLEAGEEVTTNDEDIQTVDRALNFCKRVLLEVPITDRISDLVKDICVLIHNWNSNVGNTERIHKDVRFLTAAIDQHFTIATAIEVLKRVLDKAAMSLADCDNVNSISMHYLTALDRVHEDKGCGGCDEKSCGS
jgi:hypothetical protein